MDAAKTRQDSPREVRQMTAARQDGRPLHHQILDELRRQIHSGDLGPGDALPSESDLMERFGVARGTVRQALAALRADGSVGGPRGRPPVVRDRRLTQPFTHTVSFSAWIKAMGMEPTGRLIELVQRPADEECAAALDIAPETRVYQLLRVRYADGEALMIERAVFAPSIGPIVAAMDLIYSSIYAELQRQGVVFASAHHEIDALAASADDAGLLGVQVRTPLLRTRRRAFSTRGEPLEWADDRYLASRVSFTVQNTVAYPQLVPRLEGSNVP